MFRKSIFALAAVATIAATALVSTEASAKGFKGGGWGHGWGRYAIGSAVVLGATAVYASCYRYVTTRSGDVVKVWICE